MHKTQFSSFLFRYEHKTDFSQTKKNICKDWLRQVWHHEMFLH